MDVTVLITHFQTPDLLDAAVDTFRAHYPAVQVLVVDNGSRGNSPRRLDALEERHGDAVRVHRLDENCYHGPAMHLAVRRLINTQYVFALDSDTETRRAGFLESMVDALDSDPTHYAAGRVLRVSRRGFVSDDGPVQVCWVPYKLFDRSLYLTLPPFEHHGTPNLRNCEAAVQRGLRLIEYPIEEYVHHVGQGTVEGHGYGLGWRGRISALLHRLGI